MPELSDTEFVSPQTAALILRVSTKTIARMADGGKLRSIRTDGGQRRVALVDVEARRAELAKAS